MHTLVVLCCACLSRVLSLECLGTAYSTCIRCAQEVSFSTLAFALLKLLAMRPRARKPAPVGRVTVQGARGRSRTPPARRVPVSVAVPSRQRQNVRAQNHEAVEVARQKVILDQAMLRSWPRAINGDYRFGAGRCSGCDTTDILMSMGRKNNSEKFCEGCWGPYHDTEPASTAPRRPAQPHAQARPARAAQPASRPALLAASREEMMTWPQCRHPKCWRRANHDVNVSHKRWYGLYCCGACPFNSRNKPSKTHGRLCSGDMGLSEDDDEAWDGVPYMDDRQGVEKSCGCVGDEYCTLCAADYYNEPSYR